VKPANGTHLWWLGLAYMAFVVYGSLVPLHFQALPLDEAVARFRQIPFLRLGIGSRADWVANLLLFIPLGFLYTGALAHGRGMAMRVAASILVAAAAIALSLGMEFTQLFFPQRTVSQNDIFAETLGGLLGIAAWWTLGPRWMAWHAGWQRAGAPAETAERLAWAYLAVAFAYGVLPLDLTLSGVEIFHKWRAGKLILVPFSALPGQPVQAAYELASDVLLWLPPALLWRLHARRDGFAAWRMAFGAAVLLEVLQLFVYSRVSDSSDILTGALGAALGAWAGGRLARRTGPPDPGTPARRHGACALPLMLLFIWLAVLIAVFWYPFAFHTDGAFLRERLAFLRRVPFEVYYYGTEFRAMTEVLHKLLFFAPLGGLLAWCVADLPWRWRAPAGFMAFLLILAVPLGIELGQVLLPEKYPDTTDWLLASLGGGAGYLLVRALRRQAARRAARPATRHGRAHHGPARPAATARSDA